MKIITVLSNATAPGAVAAVGPFFVPTGTKRLFLYWHCTSGFQPLTIYVSTKLVPSQTEASHYFTSAGGVKGFVELPAYGPTVYYSTSDGAGYTYDISLVAVTDL